jgi:predicted double-glycine peptidase
MMTHLKVLSALTLGLVVSLNCAVNAGSAGGTVEPPQCAQYCVHHVCQLLGVPFTLLNVCQVFPAKPGGESMSEMRRFLEGCGFECTGLRLTFDDLCANYKQAPLIAHMMTATLEGGRQPHFVVVEKADANQVRIFEGYGFPVTIPTHAFLKDWTGAVLKVEKPLKPRRPKYVPRTGQGRAWLQFDTALIDAGDIPQSVKTQQFTFRCHNAGQDDLHILKVKADCKCTILKSSGEQVIPPGGEGVIEAEYDFRAGRGKFRKELVVQSDDPYFPVAGLTVAGNGRVDVEIWPQSLDFGSIVQGEKAVARCFLNYAGDSLCEVTKAETPQSNLHIDIVKVTPKTLQALDPTMGPVLPVECRNLFLLSGSIDTNGLELGTKEYSVEVLTSLKQAARLAIPTRVTIVSPITVTPGRLFLGDLSGKDAVRETIELRARNGARFTVEQVDLGCPGLECKYETGLSSAIHTLEFAGKPKAGGLKGHPIHVELRFTDTKAGAQVEIPMSDPFYSARDTGDARELADRAEGAAP